MSIFIEWDPETPEVELVAFLSLLVGREMHLIMYSDRTDDGARTKPGRIRSLAAEGVIFKDFDLDQSYPIDYDEVIRIEIRTPST